MGRDTPLRACLEPVPGHDDGYKMAVELRELYGEDPDARRVIDVARGLEGLRRQDGIHAAAVVITREPLTEYLPVQRKPEPGRDLADAPIVTQYEMHGVEDLGLLKMDFLGLRNLDVLEITLDLVEASSGQRPDIDHVALDDPMTFDLLRRGDTVGVFQLEGAPVRALLQRLAPTSFEDIAALVALYRPGPMAQNWHTEYADRKNGRRLVDYPHPDLEEILRPTYGLMIYQEQLMRVAQQLAGYTLEEADNLRKATGKKIRSLIAQERSKFVDGCVAQGHARAFGEKIFDTIEPFADYSFNKSHSVGYGYLAYQTAFLKANYPVEYLAALLTSVRTNKDQTAVFLNECRQLGISVLVPDVNESVSDFSVHVAPDGPRSIRFGLSAVRNVGEGVTAMIVAARTEGGPFRDFYDFCGRVDPSALNKRTIESLIKAGGFDSLGHPRQGLLHVFEPLVDQTVSRRREREAGIMSLFGDGTTDGGDTPALSERVEIPESEFDRKTRLDFEKEMLGLYVSDHPLLGTERVLRRYIDCTLGEFRDAREGELRTVGGIVTALARKYTKKGDLMATFVLEDLGAALEVMVFPKTMADHGHLLEDDAIVCVKGRLDRRDDQPKIVAMELTRPEISLDGAPPVRLRTALAKLSDDRVDKLTDVLRRHPGESPVFVHLERPDHGPAVSPTTSESTPPTASSPSCASCSDPTASAERPDRRPTPVRAPARSRTAGLARRRAPGVEWDARARSGPTVAGSTRRTSPYPAARPRDATNSRPRAGPDGCWRGRSWSRSLTSRCLQHLDRGEGPGGERRVRGPVSLPDLRGHRRRELRGSPGMVPPQRRVSRARQPLSGRHRAARVHGRRRGHLGRVGSERGDQPHRARRVHRPGGCAPRRHLR